jgi:neurotrimin
MTLTIKNISREDFGGYRCIVRNSLGETDGVIRLYGTFDRMRTPSVGMCRVP